MVVARTSPAMARLDTGKVLVAGGYNDASGPLSSAELYDPATNAWSAVGNMSVPRNRPTITVLPGGKVLVTGGYSAGPTPHASAELFDPATNSWSAAGAFGGARLDHSAALLPGGRVLIAGGYDFASILGSTARRVSGTWGGAAPMGVPRSLFGLTPLPSGKLLATGGDNAGGRLNSAELYDPAGNTWAPAAPMAQIHYRHTATTIGGGRVLVAGGLDATGSGATAELYDPVSNSWAPAGTMQSARFQHTATLLRDGRVLVAGGGLAGTAIAAAELWTPTTTLSTTPSLTFGEHAIGSSATAALQITNTGQTRLLVSDVALAGAHAGDYAVTGDGCSAGVAPGATCVIGVRFAPTAVNPRSAVLSFSGNTAAGTHAVTLLGHGTSAPAPPPPPPVTEPRRIEVTLSYDYRAGKRSTRFSRMVVRGVPAGSTVTVTCAKGCARKRYVKRNARGTVSLKPMIAKAVRAGSTIQVVVARPGEVGAVKRLKIRAKKRPQLTTRCLPPGAKSPQSCG
jgi:hypothetical protein